MFEPKVQAQTSTGSKISRSRDKDQPSKDELAKSDGKRHVVPGENTKLTMTKSYEDKRVIVKRT